MSGLTKDQLSSLAMQGRNGANGPMSTLLHQGTTLIPEQAYGYFFQVRADSGFAACALGTIAAALYVKQNPDVSVDDVLRLSDGDVNRMLYHEFGSIQAGGYLSCGQHKDGDTCNHRDIGIRRMIAHWNDVHKFTRDHIAVILKGRGY